MRRRPLRVHRTGPVDVRFATRRRSRGGLWAGAALAAVVGSVTALTGIGGQEPAEPAATPPTDRRPTVEQAPLALTEDPGGTREDAIPTLPEGVVASPLIGVDRDLEIHLPSADPVVVGFHEAATATAVALRPMGALLDDRNTTRTDLPDDDDAGGDYLVLSSRGRSAGPTSAVDVVLRDDDPVLASVTGTVVDVRSYLLYGAHRDQRIEIVPAGRPELRVVAIHVQDPQVAVGDVVLGGVTPIAASVRRFPFSSQIDRETEPERFGHVHLEVQPVAARREQASGPDADADADADVDTDGGADTEGDAAG